MTKDYDWSLTANEIVNRLYHEKGGIWYRKIRVAGLKKEQATGTLIGQRTFVTSLKQSGR